jgi:cytochrome P450
MDDGPEYKHHSTKPNEAIEKIKIDEAFKAAREAARSVVSGLVGAPTASKPVDVEVKDIVDELLAKISKAWFGLPDGDHVLPGNWHWQPKGSKPTCPGHFHSPSRFMFQPNPGDIATDIGEQHGQALKKSVLGFVTYWRAQKSPQSSDLGTIGSALFNQIDDDGTLASTLIGVMMGFLPTVDGNLRSTLFEWINDGTLWDVQRAYMVNGIKHDTSALESAMREIFPELRRAMQLRPVPEVIWRTALERHVLGSVEVQRGDRIVVSLVSATQEQLLDDERDLFLVFGGDRSQKDHPTHACPGYKMAIGVLLGTLAGLMESAQLRPALSPMALQLSPLKSL